MRQIKDVVSNANCLLFIFDSSAFKSSIRFFFASASSFFALLGAARFFLTRTIPGFGGGGIFLGNFLISFTFENKIAFIPLSDLSLGCCLFHNLNRQTHRNHQRSHLRWNRNPAPSWTWSLPVFLRTLFSQQEFQLSFPRLFSLARQY